MYTVARGLHINEGGFDDNPCVQVKTYIRFNDFSQKPLEYSYHFTDEVTADGCFFCES